MRSRFRFQQAALPERRRSERLPDQREFSTQETEIGDDQMKRVLLSACLVFGSFGMTGCDSGGIQEGQPDTTKEGVPISTLGADMSKGPKMPTGAPGAPGKDTPKPEAGTPPAPDAAKK
jgi:hypothetical protein